MPPGRHTIYTCMHPLIYYICTLGTDTLFMWHTCTHYTCTLGTDTLFMWHTCTHYTCTLGTDTVHETYMHPLHLHSGYLLKLFMWNTCTHYTCTLKTDTIFMWHTHTHYTCTQGTDTLFMWHMHPLHLHSGYWHCSCDIHPLYLHFGYWHCSCDIHPPIIPALWVLTLFMWHTHTHYTCTLGTNTVHVTHAPITLALWVLTLFMWHTHCHYTCTLGTNTVHVTYTHPLYLHSGYWHCSCDPPPPPPPIILAPWVLTIQQCMLVSMSWHWKLILTQRNAATCWSAFILSINLPLKTDMVTGLKLMDSVPHRGIRLYWFTIG